MFILVHQEVVDQVDQVAMCLVTSWMAQVSEGWRCFY